MLVSQKTSWKKEANSARVFPFTSQFPLSHVRKRNIFAFLVITLVLFGALLIDAFLIEPNWIEVTRYRISAPVSSPLKIAHLTDVHTHGLENREEKVLAILAEEKPDAIVITGDTIGDTSHDILVYRRVAVFLKKLHAPLGVWVTRGNWEVWHPTSSEIGFYHSVGAELLLNASRLLRENIWVSGFDDCIAGRPDSAAALRMIPSNAYIIALFHAPQFFDQIAGHCNLALAGHTHGGQVRVPFYGPLWLPRGCGGYLSGWYERAGSSLYVNRGVGMSLYPVRFACRPEIAFFTLSPA